jgi:hypothetical protein
MMAADNKFRFFVFQFLLVNGADPSLKDNKDKSPLEYMMQLGYRDEAFAIAKDYGLKEILAMYSNSRLLLMKDENLFSLSRRMLNKELAETNSIEEQQEIHSGLVAEAIFDFKAKNENEISFAAKDLLVILDHESSNEWWYASLEGSKGWVPCKYLRVLHTAAETLQPEKGGLKRSFENLRNQLKIEQQKQLPQRQQQYHHHHHHHGEEEEEDPNQATLLLTVAYSLLESLEVDASNWSILNKAKQHIQRACDIVQRLVNHLLISTNFFSQFLKPKLILVES